LTAAPKYCFLALFSKETESMNNTLSAWAPRILSVLRIVAAAVFMVHGSQKLFGFPPSEHGSPELLSLMGFGGVLEFFGGALLLVGLFTRPVAFVLSGMMAVAYFMAHAPKSFFPALNGGDAAILFCFVFLYLVFAGPGPWSLDAARART
jgi:putative oxidoreductase